MTGMPLQICSVSAEMAPFSKTGGLGDVAGALPSALRALGHRVLTVTPRYQAYPEGWDTGIRMQFPLFGHVHEVALFHSVSDATGDVLFVDHPAIRRGGIYGDSQGGYADNLFRFALLCRAAIEATRRFALPDSDGRVRPLSDAGPVRFLTHDWHAGLLPVYLRAHYQSNGLLSDATVTHVIHNLAHQGVHGADAFRGLDLTERWAGMLDMGGRLNCMKAAIVASEQLVTVSPTYAAEIQHAEHGCGLHGLLRARRGDLFGILNGIDTADWSPLTDRHLVETYDSTALGVGNTAPGPDGGKLANKLAIQKEFGLPVTRAVPIVGFIGRLTGQKGIDLLATVGAWLAGTGAAQLVVLGTGEPRYEQALADVAKRWPDRVAVQLKFDVGLSHRITAGADILAMPSHFEPCGLNQMYALAYGTPPVVHATGGLADTVDNHDPQRGGGNGWSFSPGTADAFKTALGRAVRVWHRDPEAFRAIALRGMEVDRSWERSAAKYALVMGR